MTLENQARFLYEGGGKKDVKENLPRTGKNKKRASGSTGGKGWQNFAVKSRYFERRKETTPISCEIGVTI